MNENLPAHMETSLSEVGSISYANEVIAIIAGMAASEIDGVAEMGGASSIADILGRSRKPITKGVRVEVGSEEASVDLILTVEYGKPIQKVCREVQESVRKSIETMTGLHVVKVDVHVQGVSFERETKELAESMQRAKMDTAPLMRGEAEDVDYMEDTPFDDLKDDERAMDTDIPAHDEDPSGEEAEEAFAQEPLDEPEADGTQSAPEPDAEQDALE